MLKIRAENATFNGILIGSVVMTEILVCAFDAVSGPGTVPGPETASNRQTSISVMTTEPIKMPLKVAFSALILRGTASRSQNVLWNGFLTPEGSEGVPNDLRILHDVIALLQENKIRKREVSNPTYT